MYEKLLILAVQLILPTVLSQHLFGQSQPTIQTPIPDYIVIEAQDRQIPLSAIKFRGQQWVACLAEGSSTETCITLGQMGRQSRDPVALRASSRRFFKLRIGDRLEFERTGKPKLDYTLDGRHSISGQTSELADLGTLRLEEDSSFTFSVTGHQDLKVTVVKRDEIGTDFVRRRYKRESPFLVRTSDVGLVSDYMDQHPDEPFFVIVTVPSECEPCRRYESVVTKALVDGKSSSITIKTFLLEYPSFQEAQRNVVGPGAIFPSTMLFAARKSTPLTTTPKITIGMHSAVLRTDFSKTVSATLKRGVPHAVAYGLISQESLMMLVKSL